MGESLEIRLLVDLADASAPTRRVSKSPWYWIFLTSVPKYRASSVYILGIVAMVLGSYLAYLYFDL